MNSFKHYTLIDRFSFFRRKKIFAEDGEIIFLNDSIIIKGREIGVAKIKTISFLRFNDYVDKKFNEPGSTISKGIDNAFTLEMNDGTKPTFYVQQEYRYQLREMRPQLVHYHNEGKLHFLNLIDILGIEDYNAIRIFKKSLPDGGDVKSY